MATTILLCITVINIVLWIILFRFLNKKISGDYIEDISTEIESLIKEINRTTETNLTLLENRVEQLRVLIDTADKHIAKAKKEIHQIAKESEIPESRSKDISTSLLENTEKQPQKSIVDIKTAASIYDRHKSEAPKISQNNIKQSVLNMNSHGYIPEKIASELNISVSEVNMIIDLFN